MKDEKIFCFKECEQYKPEQENLAASIVRETGEAVCEMDWRCNIWLQKMTTFHSETLNASNFNLAHQLCPHKDKLLSLNNILEGL